VGRRKVKVKRKKEEGKRKKEEGRRTEKWGARDRRDGGRRGMVIRQCNCLNKGVPKCNLGTRKGKRKKDSRDRREGRDGAGRGMVKWVPALLRRAVIWG
jgi:hypothetical protein